MGYIAMIICYPVVSGFMMVLLSFMIMAYPFLRKTNHHGMYDPFDIGLSFLAVYYLRFAVWLLHCCSE